MKAAVFDSFGEPSQVLSVREKSPTPCRARARSACG